MYQNNIDRQMATFLNKKIRKAPKTYYIQHSNRRTNKKIYLDNYGNLISNTYYPIPCYYYLLVIYYTLVIIY